MKKFFVTFAIPTGVIDDWMKTVSEEERTKQTNDMMQSWNTWMSEHESQILDKGLPLGKTKRVTKDGIIDTRNDLNWYLVIEAEDHEKAAEMLKGHPHIEMIPGAYIEVMDASRPMPQ